MTGRVSSAGCMDWKPREDSVSKRREWSAGLNETRIDYWTSQCRHRWESGQTGAVSMNHGLMAWREWFKWDRILRAGNSTDGFPRRFTGQGTEKWGCGRQSTLDPEKLVVVVLRLLKGQNNFILLSLIRLSCIKHKRFYLNEWES